MKRGEKATPEQRARMSEAAKGVWRDPAHRDVNLKRRANLKSGNGRDRPPIQEDPPLEDFDEWVYA